MRKFSVILTLAVLSCSGTGVLAQSGTLSGVTTFQYELNPLPAKISDREKSIRDLIDQKLKTAGIQTASDSPAHLQIDVKSDSSRLNISILVTETVSLPNNPSVKKVVTIWSKDLSCPAKRLDESLATLMDAFAIAYLKDNRANKPSSESQGQVKPEHEPSSDKNGLSDATALSSPPAVKAAGEGAAIAPQQTTAKESTSPSEGTVPPSSTVAAPTVASISPTTPAASATMTASAPTSEISHEVTNTAKTTTTSPQPAISPSSSSLPTAASKAAVSSLFEQTDKIDVTAQFNAISVFAKNAADRVNKIWHAPKNAKSIVYEFTVDSTGAIESAAAKPAGSANDAMANSALKALKQASPFKSILTKELVDIDAIRFMCIFTAAGVKVNVNTFESKIYLMNGGVRLLNHSDFPPAVRKLELALKYDKDYILAKKNLAIAYNNEGLELRDKPLKAKLCFEKALALDPDNKTTKQNLKGIQRLVDFNNDPGVQTKPVPEKLEVPSRAESSTQSSDKLQSTKLSDSWKEAKLDDIASAKKPVRIRFQLNSRGTFEMPPEIFNSSGSNAVDNAALECLQSSGPYTFYLADKPKAFYDALFDANSKTAKIANAQIINYSEYMIAVQRKIRDAWKPPKADSSKRIKVIFLIDSTGSVRNIKLEAPSGAPDEDEAALKAVKSCHFAIPPAGAPDYMPIEFIFDYNILNAKR